MYNKAKIIIKRDASMQLYADKEILDPETYASGVGLWAGLLLVYEGMSCPRDRAPDFSILRPTAFAIKSMSSAEACYSNIEKKHY